MHIDETIKAKDQNKEQNEIKVEAKYLKNLFNEEGMKNNKNPIAAKH